MTARTPARRQASKRDELDRVIADAEARAVVVWRSEPLPLRYVPEQIARTGGRPGRELLYGSYVEALEALNPLYEQRLAAWFAQGDPAAAGVAAADVSAELGAFGVEAETPYYAALRRYLALIGIEQGDASEADLWHIVRGSSWAGWFGVVEVASAVTAAGGASGPSAAAMDGWRAAEERLAGGGTEATDPEVGAAVSRARASLVGSPEWLTDELGVDPTAAASFVDFAAFVRLWRLRRASAVLTYEGRLSAAADPALRRAYYAGIVGHQTGVAVAEAGYLAAIPQPYASASDLRSSLLAAMVVESLEANHGLRWWREPAASQTLGRMSATPAVADAVAELGYDALDWRPALRQIRTRLIGEMSGYGGPNITTRAGTRKV